MSVLLHLRSFRSALSETHFVELSRYSLTCFKRSMAQNPSDQQRIRQDKDFKYEDQPFISKLLVEEDGTPPFAVRFNNAFKRKYGFRELYERRYRKTQEEENERYFENVEVLGVDQAAASLTLCHHGGVKFRNMDKWIYSKDKEVKELPCNYDERFILTGLDLSGLNIGSHALAYFDSLSQLTHLSIANSPRADDWWLDFISGAMPALKHLDISGCSRITYRGIGILYRLNKLETLCLKNVRYNPFVEMTLFELEKVLPNLKLYGVEAWENEKKKEDGLPEVSDSCN